MPDLSKRLFPRVRSELPLAYELVSWDEHDESQLVNPKWISSWDLSPSGVSFVVPVDFTIAERRRLSKGLLKVRLAIQLSPSDEPVITFARLVWGFAQAERHGFSFIDITESGFRRIHQFVENFIQGSLHA